MRRSNIPTPPITRSPGTATLIHLLIGVFVVVLLSACSPELLPVQIQQEPTPTPRSSLATPLEGPAVAAPSLVVLSMIDESNGWGVSDTAVLRTDDGGITWHNVGPTDSVALGYSVTSDFLDVQHGWVLVPDPNNMLTGSLFRTADGGSTWSQALVPFGGGALRFLDANDGWMMASLGAGAGSMGVAVYQTTDGGSTWAQAYINDPNQPGAGDSLPLGGLKNSLAPSDMKNAWIGGVTYAPGVIYLYETHDSGHTWAQSSLKVPAGYEEAELETTGPIFTSSGVAFLPVHLSSQNGVMLAIYVSRDGGMSWLLTPTLIPFGGQVDFVSQDVGFVWNLTYFYMTKDGGQTWKTISPDVAFGDSFRGMDFLSPLVGFVLTDDANGSRVLYKTVDGGATWNIVAK